MRAYGREGNTVISNKQPNAFLLNLMNCLDALFHIGTLIAAYFISTFIASELGLASVELSRTPDLIWGLLGLAVLIVTVVFFVFDIYSFSCGTGIAVAADVFSHILILITFLLTIRERGEFVLIWISTATVISALLTSVRYLLSMRIKRFFEYKSYKLRRILLVIGSSDNAIRFIRELESDNSSSDMIIGYVSDTDHRLEGYERLGNLDELSSVIEKHRPTDAVFAKGADGNDIFSNLVHICEDRCIGVYLIPDTQGFLRSRRQLEIYGSLPIINIHATPLDKPFYAFLKRATDIAVAVLLIALTLPIMIFAAIGVKLSSPGPILFKQIRVGQRGRTFTILKFRSMRVNSISDVSWSSGKDSRKTRFGNFIRRTAIDELPQLFNVLAGSMSLVGPRPELPRFVNEFRQTLPLYMLKHKVKPGITGLAQIRGFRGDTSLDDRIGADIEYIENWSLMLDIKILLRTPFRMINTSERATEPKKSSPHGTSSSGPIDKCTKAKILYAASTYGHIERFHTKYINALKSEGYCVKTMARGACADYDIPFEKKLFSASNSACRKMIRDILRTEAFDILILNTSLAAFHIRLSLPRKGRPKVLNIVHGYLFNGNTAPLKRIALILAEKLVAGRTDTVITMNRYDEYMAKKWHLCRGRVLFCHGMGAKIRYNGSLPEELRKRYKSDGKFVVSYVAEMSRRKNHQMLIYAMPHILEKVPSTELWLVGDGELRENLEEISLELGVNGSIRFFGHRDDAGAFIEASDAYISTSLSEGMPFNIIEALGYGKTVLASRVKGHTDILGGGAGILFDPASESDMVSKLSDVFYGKTKIDESKIDEAFANYCEDKAFYGTYKLMKESL